MLRRLTVIVAIAAWFASSGAARAEANVVRVAKQFGVAYMQYMVMQELKLIEKHAKAAGLDITTEWATVPFLRRDERRADLRLGRFRLARHPRHHHDLVEDQGHGRSRSRASPASTCRR